LTYSIVARDSETGELGVAVQSRAFNTGAVVPWVAPAVGAVATQAFSEPGYGPRALDLLRAGETAEQALAALVAADAESQFRQVAVVDADGRVAVHVGEACIAAAGFVSGEGYSAQANMVDSERVWEAMAEAFEATARPLSNRLLAALDAAEAAGGDWRGKQAGAIVVAPAEGQPWERDVDLRVDDHDEPLHELRRLLGLRDAYRAMRAPPGPTDEQLAALSPLDARWAAIFGAAASGQVEAGRELLRPLLDEEPRWGDFVRAIAARNLMPHAAELLE
jgi:uncharacterized Ntn-hydrolase superfamily protein